jgi:hypothetical protein
VARHRGRWSEHSSAPHCGTAAPRGSPTGRAAAPQDLASRQFGRPATHSSTGLRSYEGMHDSAGSVCHSHGVAADDNTSCVCERFFQVDTECESPKTVYALGTTAAVSVALLMVMVHTTNAGTSLRRPLCRARLER